MSWRKSDPEFIHSYERGMLRSAFVSLFWGIITERKKREGLTLQSLAKNLGKNKGEVSRWFNGDPNWTVNTIANLSSALNVDVEIRAIDRVTGAIFTPSGLQVPVVQTTTAVQPKKISTGTSASFVPRKVMVTRIPEGSSPSSVGGMEAAA